MIYMANPIYLTRIQKKMLDEAGCGVQNLTWDTLDRVLTVEDVYTIKQQSITNFAIDAPLGKLGFIFEPTDELFPALSAQDNASNYLKTTNLTINCFCYKDHTNVPSFIVWEEAEEPNNLTNSMVLEHNLTNILTAMGKVLGFGEIKKSQQFALMLCTAL